MIARQAQMGGASVSEAKEINKINRSFSLSRAVQAASFGKALEGAEAEWSQEAAKEYQMRGLQMSGQIGIPASALYRAGVADNFRAGSGGRLWICCYYYRAWCHRRLAYANYGRAHWCDHHQQRYW